jgi:hypothetical protein
MRLLQRLRLRCVVQLQLVLLVGIVRLQVVLLLRCVLRGRLL